MAKNDGGFEMTKSEMLMEYITRDIVSWIMESENVSMSEALRAFYSSETFDKLTNPDTGLYLDSSAAVYALFEDERAHGHIVQNEL